MIWWIFGGIIILGGVGVYGAWCWSRLPYEMQATHKAIIEGYESFIDLAELFKEEL